MLVRLRHNMRGLARSSYTSLAAIALGVASVAAASVADTRYVDASAAPGGNGQSWNSAYRFLQDALAAAQPGSGITEIRIAQGLYLPDRSEAAPNGTGDRDASFFLISNVPLRGGFAGLSSQDPDERDIAAFETILSGDLLGNDGPDFANTEDNSLTVILGGSPGGTYLIEGISFTGGNADISSSPGTMPGASGGGVFIKHGDVSIIECTFHANHARALGAGAYLSETTAHIERCSFHHNRDGGGLTLHYSTSSVIDVDFYDNEGGGSGGGGGVRVGSGIADFQGCRFLNNSASVGGGLHGGSLNFGSSSACISLHACTFIGNVATVAGGGALISTCGNTVISNCTFDENRADMLGSAFILGGEGNVEVRNCTVTSNSCAGFGPAIIAGVKTNFINCVIASNQSSSGSILLYTKVPSLINCTVAFNEGSLFSADLDPNSLAVDTLYIKNSILWGNQGGMFHESVGNVVITHSNVQGGWHGAGINNITSYPLFVQPGGQDFRLSFASQCINAGDNSALPSHITTDLAGNSRIQDGIVDMGAYEGGHHPQTPTASIDWLGSSQFAFLVPMGAPYNPVEYASIVVWNVEGPDGSQVTVSQHALDQHPGAEGYSTFDVTLEMQTSLLDGQHRSWVTIPFDAESLGGLDPLEVDLAFYNDATGKWELAVGGNTQNSPDHKSPIGNRHMQVGGDFGQSFVVGDYGVYWNPETNRGVAWGNVDYAGDFRPGVLICIGDLTDSGEVNVLDLQFLLDEWGSIDSPADLNDDGIVDLDDLLILLSLWGKCG